MLKVKAIVKYLLWKVNPNNTTKKRTNQPNRFNPYLCNVNKPKDVTLIEIVAFAVLFAALCYAFNLILN